MHMKLEWPHAVRQSMARAGGSRRDPGPDESPKGTRAADRFADQGRGRRDIRAESWKEGPWRGDGVAWGASTGGQWGLEAGS